MELKVGFPLVLILIYTCAISVDGRGVSFEQILLMEGGNANALLGSEQNLKNYDVSTCSMITCIKMFYLWNRANGNGQVFEKIHLDNNRSIEYNHLEPNKPTYFVVHGFLGFGLEKWILDAKDKLLKREDCNVISVDWYAGSNYIGYKYAVANVPLVGGGIALLLSRFHEFKGLDYAVVHLIGHSLGAHASGFAAKNLQGKIKRITGLDPAGPDFTKVKPTQRLDKNDAEFVDIIHTNGCLPPTIWFTDCYGIDFSIGHVDFWPNGGRHQPACKRLLCSEEENVRGQCGCSHQMAYYYFLESIDYSMNDTYFVARPCDSWETYLEGNCTSCGAYTEYMGYSVNSKSKGEYFLKTLKTSPYAERDPSCKPGYYVEFSSTIIIAITTFLVMLILILVIFGKTVCKEKLDAGLVTSSTEAVDSDVIDETTKSKKSLRSSLSSKLSVASPSKVPEDSDQDDDMIDVAARNESINQDDDAPILGCKTRKKFGSPSK